MGLTRVALVAVDHRDADRWAESAPEGFEVVARATVGNPHGARGHVADRVEITDAARVHPRIGRAWELSLPCLYGAS